MSAPPAALKTEQAILSRFQELRNEVDGLASRASDLSAELQEHELVLKALEPLDGGRKCFRLARAPPPTRARSCRCRRSSPDVPLKPALDSRRASVACRPPYFPGIKLVLPAVCVAKRVGT